MHDVRAGAQQASVDFAGRERQVLELECAWVSTKVPERKSIEGYRSRKSFERREKMYFRNVFSGPTPANLYRREAVKFHIVIVIVYTELTA